MAQAIRKVKGVLKANASYRKKAAFVYTGLDMCNAKGAQAILDGLQKSKKYKGKIFSVKAIKGKGISVPVKLSPWPPKGTKRPAIQPPRRPGLTGVRRFRLLRPVVPSRRSAIVARGARLVAPLRRPSARRTKGQENTGRAKPPIRRVAPRPQAPSPRGSSATSRPTRPQPPRR